MNYHLSQLISNLPIPELDDKTFDELVNEARARIPLYAPGWTDHNLSDPGITFIELFSWLAEMQIYRLNLLRDVNYLKFLKLLQSQPKPATAAKVDVTFTTTSKDGEFIAKGTRLETKDTESGKLIFETDEDLMVLPVTLEKVKSFVDLKYTDLMEANDKIGIFYYAFGEKAQKDNALYLGLEIPDSVDYSGKEVLVTFYLYENGLPPIGQHGEMIVHNIEQPQVIHTQRVKWEYWQGTQWNTLSLKKDNTMSLTQNGRIYFVIPSDASKQNLPLPIDDGYIWIRCRVIQEGYEIPPRIDTIRLNTISATHGQTVKEELLERKDAIQLMVDESLCSGLPYQVFQSKNKPIIIDIETPELIIHSNEMIVHNIMKDHEKWELRDDFDASGPDDNHYIIRPDKGEIEFGDGINGRIPPKGSKVILTYRFGSGEKGNINSNTIVRAYNAGQNIMNYHLQLGNERPAYGGSDEESLDEAQSRVKKDLKVPYTAVTSEDYEYIAKNTPGLRVARAYAFPDPEKNLVTVTVVPYSPQERPTPSDDFLKTVCMHLDKHRLITTNLRVVPPKYIQISVDAEVQVEPQKDIETTKSKIEKALDDFLDPIKGSSDGDGWQFGRSVYQSEIYAVIASVDGVDCITRLNISAAGDYEYQNGNIKIPPLYLVYPGTHNIEVHIPETICKKKE